VAADNSKGLPSHIRTTICNTERRTFIPVL